MIKDQKLSTAGTKLYGSRSGKVRATAAAVLGHKGGSVTASRMSSEQRIARSSKAGLAAYTPPLSPADLHRDHEFLKVLDERERTIIERRFSESHQTLEQIATSLGLTRQRVHQLQNCALGKIKKAKVDYESRQIK